MAWIEKHEDASGVVRYTVFDTDRDGHLIKKTFRWYSAALHYIEELSSEVNTLGYNDATAKLSRENRPRKSGET